MSHKGGQPDPGKDYRVEDIVGKFRKPVEGIAFLDKSANAGYMYMTDGGAELVGYTTLLEEEDRCPSRDDGGGSRKDTESISKGGSDKNG